MSAAPPELRPEPQPFRPGPLSILLRLALGLMALAIPLFAVWLVTSLFLGAGLPLAAALPLGILVPLAIPIGWDLWAEARFRRKKHPPARIMTRADRIRLRILATCVLLIAVPILVFGRASGTALADHGHWFLFGGQGPFADDVRGGIRGFAGSLAGITGQELVAEASYRSDPEGSPRLPSADQGRPSAPAPTRGSDLPEKPPTPSPTPAPTPVPAGSAPPWPLPDEPHPAIRTLSDDDVSSLDVVAERIRSREADPFQRVKAIHDFVVRWVSYDGEALRRDYQVPDQSAGATFQRRTGTCDGYVRMMQALGERLGFEMERIVGRSRATGAGLDGFYHSWIAVRIGDRRYLVDPTWDAGSLFGKEFRARYSTSYLFTPPEIFAYDHLPNDPADSLLDPPLTENAFRRRPALSAHFFAEGLKLQGIDRALTEVDDVIGFRIDNPNQVWVLVLARPLLEGTDEPDFEGSRKPFNCVVPSQANPIEASCNIGPGTWLLELYANDAPGGRFPSIGFLKARAER